MVEGGGFEPPKDEPSDLQSDPFGRSGTPPKIVLMISRLITLKSTAYDNKIYQREHSLSHGRRIAYSPKADDECQQLNARKINYFQIKLPQGPLTAPSNTFIA